MTEVWPKGCGDDKTRRGNKCLKKSRQRNGMGENKTEEKKGTEKSPHPRRKGKKAKILSHC